MSACRTLNPCRERVPLGEEDAFIGRTIPAAYQRYRSAQACGTDDPAAAAWICLVCSEILVTTAAGMSGVEW
jgi:hypothetical protein